MPWFVIVRFENRQKSFPSIDTLSQDPHFPLEPLVVFKQPQPPPLPIEKDSLFPHFVTVINCFEIIKSLSYPLYIFPTPRPPSFFNFNPLIISYFHLTQPNPVHPPTPTCCSQISFWSILLIRDLQVTLKLLIVSGPSVFAERNWLESVYHPIIYLFLSKTINASLSETTNFS